MTAAVSSANRQRLIKLLGLLGSEYAGERDAAGLAACRLMRDRGLTWQDVLDPNIMPKVTRDTVSPWRTTTADCLRHPGDLRPWERQFLHSLSDFNRISAKQRSVLGSIASRVLQRAAA